MAALEQRHAELLFERLDLARQRRLREVELLGRAGEGQMPRRGLETLEQVERGQARPRARRRTARLMPFLFLHA